MHHRLLPKELMLVPAGQSLSFHMIYTKIVTLLKTYLEVDLNEFLQQKMDSELFEGVDERAKSEFIGNFFHFIKCRFQDCNLV